MLPQNHESQVSDPAWLIGFDEVGMGCLAGPVVAAAFAYPWNDEWTKRKVECIVRDSKKMNEKQREESELWLRNSGALFSVVEISPAEIDSLNILRASQKAMWNCFLEIRKRLPESPGEVALLIDGSRLPADFAALKAPFVPQTIVKGDAKSFPIAAASILAKQHRDKLMSHLAQEHPHYGWDANVGYPTTEHKIAIHQHGPTVHHRRSFNWELTVEQLAIL